MEVAEFLSGNDFLHVLHSIEVLFLPYDAQNPRTSDLH